MDDVQVRGDILTQALVLTSWVRNSFFVESPAQQHISIEHVQDSEAQVSPTE